nr:unnamed protein product [Callosobruchus analis]
MIWMILTFFKRFRLLKNTVLHVLELIEEQLEYPHDLNNSVSPINQLLMTLRFYASSGHVSQVADFMGMHESTACRVIARVSRILAGLYKNFVKLPQPEEIVHIQTAFYQIAKFSRVIGAVDGTHMKIQSPGDSGYAQKRYMLTPLANPITRGQTLYNEAHIRRRNVVERTIWHLEEEISCSCLWFTVKT